MNRIGFLIPVLLFCIAYVNGQEISNERKDTLAAAVSKLSKSIQGLEKVRISGYIQAQYQLADTIGAKSFNGGDFPKASAQRFMVRRGYFKMTYNGGIATYVLQINVNEKGFNIRDAYFSMKDPWLKVFTLTGGIFYRPFGFELPYPTHLRETPELARVNQVLFPGERDLGASLLFQAPEKSKFHPFKIEAGLFAGNGTSAETDDKLDFIGRMNWSKDIKKSGFSYGVGLSYYNGSVYQAKKQVYETSEKDGVTIFSQVLSDTLIGDYQKREYLGMDAQIGFKSIAGSTRIRAEYISGTQPSADTTSMSPTDKTGASIFIRKFNGSVFYIIHTLPDGIHSLVIKYDSYDPNTRITGNEIGKSAIGYKATNSTDLKYTTWGIGYYADVNKNLRITLYYDLVKNETSTNLSKYSYNLKDNIFTIRLQYKF